MESAIKIRDLTLNFQKQLILNKINLEILRGDMISIEGGSGTGKTTLLKIIAGFIQPDAGDVYVNGQRMSDKTAHFIRQNMSYVPQNTQVWHGITSDLVSRVFSLKNNKHLKNWKRMLEEYMSIFELSEKILQQDYSLLSGGEKQRILFILSLLLERDIVLLDEPFSGVQSKLRHKMIDIISNMLDRTFVIVTHDEVLTDMKRLKKFELGS